MLSTCLHGGQWLNKPLQAEMNSSVLFLTPKKWLTNFSSQWHTKQQHVCAPYTLMGICGFSHHPQTFFCQALQWFIISTVVNDPPVAVSLTWLSEALGWKHWSHRHSPLNLLEESVCGMEKSGDTGAILEFHSSLMMVYYRYEFVRNNKDRGKLE